MKKFICIEGNIGAGKTTMARLLQKELNANLILEEFEENHFLPLFYKDPETYGFSVEYSFLLDRYRQLKKQENTIMNSITVSDYYIEKCLYFASINLNPVEYGFFLNTYNNLINTLPQPDILIYFHIDINHLSENIKKRSRDFENDLAPEYLKKVEEKYSEFSKKKRNCAVLNFYLPNNQEETYAKVFSKITSILQDESTIKSLSITI